MRGGVAEHLHCVGILGGQNGKLGVVLERAREVHQFAVSARNQSFLRQTRRNLMRDLHRGSAARHFADGAIRQRDLNGVHAAVCSPVETNSLLAQAGAVKARAEAWECAQFSATSNEDQIHAPAAEAREKSLIITSSSRIIGNPCENAIMRASAA